MGCLLDFNSSRLLILSFNIFFFFFLFFLPFISHFSTHHFLSPPHRCSYMRSSSLILLHLFYSVDMGQSIIGIVGSRIKRWSLSLLQSSCHASPLETPNGWSNGGTSKPWLIMVFKGVMLSWLGFAIVPIILHAISHVSLMISKAFLLMMALITW